MVTLEEAVEARNEALRRVEAGADKDWLEAAFNHLIIVAYRALPFIADALWENGLEPTREPRALGPVFTLAQKLGIIRKTGNMQKSKRRHMTPITEWVLA